MPNKFPNLFSEMMFVYFQENLWRTTLFAEHYNFWSAEGYEFDEGEKQKSLAVQQELLMKLFAVSSSELKRILFEGYLGRIYGEPLGTINNCKATTITTSMYVWGNITSHHFAPFTYVIIINSNKMVAV